VEETLVEGASVARIARDHGVNANQLFGWRRLYLSGRLGESKPAMKLLPVRVGESLPPATTHAHNEGSALNTNTCPEKLRHAQMRIEGSADPELVRVIA
jgi:transposase